MHISSEKFKWVSSPIFPDSFLPLQQFELYKNSFMKNFTWENSAILLGDPFLAPVLTLLENCFNEWLCLKYFCSFIGVTDRTH